MLKNANGSVGQVIVLLFVFFLLACSSPCRQWQLECVLCPCPEYNSGHLYLPAFGSENNLELEFFRGSSGINLYLNVASLPLPFAKENSDLVPIELMIEENRTEYLVHRLQGGQRALFTPEATSAIINALFNGERVFIEAGRYHAEIVPTRFVEQYQRLMQIPMIQIPQ